MAKVQLSLDQVLALAKNHKVIPIVETLFSGSETPLSIFEKLAAAKAGSFLLESAQQGVWARYSFIGVNNRGTLSQRAGESPRWQSATGDSPLPDGKVFLPDNGLDSIEAIQNSWFTNPIGDLPPLTSGLVGLLSWDLIREIENLGPAPARKFNAPVVAMAMFRDLVVLDHQTSNLLLVSNVYVDDETEVSASYLAALEHIDAMRSDLLKPSETMLADLDLNLNLDPKRDFRSVTGKTEFLEAVNAAKKHVRAGDVFQVVISQRFEIETKASALDIYRVLRAMNPSPYMYLLNFEDEDGAYAIVGSSPEALVTVNQGSAVTHPIAGSRPRGTDAETDQQLEDSLLSDRKERSEHLMLVDLARNDLLKVCEPSSVAVTEFMQVHRFSHIMHLVSTVEGRVSNGISPVDVFRATFPAGTLSGAPKPRALEIIDQLENGNRGVFGGVVGYFDFAGNADLAIAIRTSFVRNGIAHVQAGAGIVLDSDPESEYLETLAKASAPLRSVAMANAMVRRRN